MTRTPFAFDALDRLVRELAGSSEEREVVEMARSQGVLGLLARAQIEPYSRFFDKASEREHVSRGLRLLAGLFEITRALESEGVPYLVLKGASSSQQLYGTPYAREYGDLDILVPLEWLDRVEPLLEGLGFQFLGRPETPGRLQAFRQFVREVSAVHLRTRVLLDLHWRLFGHWVTYDPAFEELWRRRVRLELGHAGAVWTLDPTDTLILLAFHGSQDGWRYLKSLLDFAVAVSSWTGDLAEVERRLGPRYPLFRHALVMVEKLLECPALVDTSDFGWERARCLEHVRLWQKRQPRRPRAWLMSSALWKIDPLSRLGHCLRAAAVPSPFDIAEAELPNVWLYLVIKIKNQLRRTVEEAFRRYESFVNGRRASF